MRRLVLHTGGRHTGWAVAQRQLARSRPVLRRHGVLVPDSDDPAQWHRMAIAALGHGEAPELERLLGSASPEDTVLIGSDRADDLLAEPSGRAALRALAARYGGDVLIAVVVGDQLDQVNRAYCQAVLDLRTAEPFEQFAARAAEEGRFDPRRRYAALLGDAGSDLVAVPSSALDPARPASAVLAAAGLALPEEPPAADIVEPVPGPTLVAATRLLHKRLWRHGAFQRHDRTALVALARRLRREAEERGWDEEEFWGWSSPRRDELAAALVAADEAFAREAWGAPWPEPSGRRRRRTVSLTTAEPRLVAAVVDTVHALVVETLGQRAARRAGGRSGPGTRLRAATSRLLAAAQRRVARSGK